MKLDRLTSFGARLAGASLTAAFAFGCSATTSQPPQAANAAIVGNVAGTTNLMSAELAGPAPRVGKARSTFQRSDDSDDAFGDLSAPTNGDDESAPKEARRSDGSHRGGSFGTPSK